MGVIKNKPYEISIWEDRLVQEDGIEYYKEVKLAVIGSDRMESPNRAFNPVLTENVNGEKTLTFSIAYKYFDDFKGEMVENPFYPYLINERKVKLFYNDEWYEFLIKESDESSKEYIFDYTAKELFSLELAKMGYDVVLDTSLDNNQGTIVELAKKVLENCDWEVDEDNSDLLIQKVQEPIYQATINQAVEVLDVNTNTEIQLSSQETIYIFYSYVNNKIKSNVQFIRYVDRNLFEYDDDNVITAPNYRFTKDIDYHIDENGQVDYIIVDTETDTRISILTIYPDQAYRLVYNIRTVYDPVMGRTVDLYQADYNDGKQDIYHYLDYDYTTSDVAFSYITNGSDFQLLENGSLQGWDNAVATTGQELQPIQLTTYPEITLTGKLATLNELSEINAFLELKFNGTLTNDYQNAYYNSGFEDSATMIDHISAGEEFVLRTRYYTSDTQHGERVPGRPSLSSTTEGLRVIVAKYERVNGDYYYRQILPGDIVLDFNGVFKPSPNIINNGVFDVNHRQYLIDDVVQVPSTVYIYIDKNDENKVEYIWNPKEQLYEEKTNNSIFADYYYTKAKAKLSFSNEILKDPKFDLGIFLYIKDSNLVGKYIYLQDIQLTRYYETKDEDGNPIPVVMGNVPTATSQITDCFYLKPHSGAESSEVNTYKTIDSLAAELGISQDLIQPVYNEKSEKILSITASHSNYFNILQDLCETFECWLDIRVNHEADGRIKIDSQKNPIKKVAFREYAGKDNFAGFKNGINLSGIERQIDSNEIVTKLIVEPVQSEYSDTGSIDIQSAASNPSKQSYIINFSYFLNRGLISDKEKCWSDLSKYYRELSDLNSLIIDLQKEFIYLEKSIIKVSSERDTYTDTIETAQNSFNDAMQTFEDATGWTYDEFLGKYQNIDEWARAEEDKSKDYLESDTVMDAVGMIYASTSTINTYSGLLSNLDEEYHQLDLKCYGAKDYGVSISSTAAMEAGEGGDISVNPATQIVIDGYTTGIGIELIDSNGGTVVFYSSPIERIFNASNAAPYEYVRFIQLPANYNLRYYINNTPVELEAEQAKASRFPIVNLDNDEPINRRFVVVPTKEYAEEYIGYQKQIDELIKQKQAIEKEFYRKYSRFLQEGTWSSQDYIDPELYYLDAMQVSNTSAQPKVSYTINVLEVSQLDGLQNYDFRVGDKTYIEDTDFFGYITETYESIDETIQTPIREEVIVSEVEWHLDEPDNNTITVQNYKTRFEDLFQRVSATVQTVQRNEITYPKTSSILDKTGLINSALLANSLNNIGGIGFSLNGNGSVSATNEGLLIYDLLSSANQMKLTSSGLQITTDGGKSWNTAIDATGISASSLTAGTINTQQILLVDGNNTSFRWDKSGLSAYGFNEEDASDSYNLKTYVRFDKYGLYGVKDGENYVATSLEDVEDQAHFGITWKGFFIKNTYEGGGKVSITSEDDIVVENGNEIQKIKIGALRDDTTQEITGYGMRIRDDEGNVVLETGDDGNLTMTGTINAQAGMFTGQVSVGNPEDTHILIDGFSNNPTIQSSNYSEFGNTGWIIDSNGDATFSNVSVRGAIKTSVFEYEEIQAVGGAFMFRPSSTIKTARYVPSEVESEDEYGEPTTRETYYHYENGVKVYNDLILTLEHPLMFRVDNWVKISNYIGSTVDAQDLSSFGLVHIYRVSKLAQPYETPALIGTAKVGHTSIGDTEVDEDSESFEGMEYEITLEGGCAVLDDISLENLPGGALIDFGNVLGTQNYGIGINSSDSYINLPARAISLFETIIRPNQSIKVGYNLRGILGTLPPLDSSLVCSAIYTDHMVETQGIYTDNMYIGDANQYLAFYEDDEGDKHFKIKSEEFLINTGTIGQTGYLYLSTEDYPLKNTSITPQEAGITINGHTPTAAGTDGKLVDDPAWRQVIGSKFGVDSEGNLYASNANIKGTINADYGYIASGITIGSNGPTIATIESNASIAGYSVEIKISDIDYVNNSAILVAIPYYQGSTTLPTLPGGANYSYRWYKENIALSDTIIEPTISGSTTNTLVLGAGSDLNAIYICVISN